MKASRADNAIEVLYVKWAANYTLLKSTNVAEVSTNQATHGADASLTSLHTNVQCIHPGDHRRMHRPAFTFFDNIKIGSAVDNDLKAAAITAPARVNAGSTYTVDATVANEGMLKSAAYTVDLFANGTKVDTKQMEAPNQAPALTLCLNVQCRP